MREQLQLPDGRTLDYAISKANGTLPLLWCHGSPGSVVALPGLATACKQKDVPLLTWSRSGYGDSTRHRGRSVVDEVKDVQALLDHLGIKRCMVGGWSGGGPHALACAARLPACAATLVIASVAPYEAEGLNWLEGQGEDNVEEAEVTLKGEAALQEWYKPQRDDMLQTTAAQFVETAASLFPPVDKKAVVENQDIATFFEQTFAEAFKHNSDGPVDDSIAFMEYWGFDVKEVQSPVVLLHGTADKMCPFAHGKWIAGQIPAPKLTTYLEEGEGHVSLFVGKEKELLEELLRLADSGSPS